MTLTETPATTETGGPTEHRRIVIVGTGFAGIGMAVRLKQSGIDDFVVLERADGPGGTWRANTYPGCQCDVPSSLYSLSFAPKADWTTTFPLQPELKAYLEDVTERFGITPHIRWSTPLVDASWDERTQRWDITTGRGSLTADALILGVGGLAEPSLPDIPGIERFEGEIFHSARWNHDHDLTGERVAVIGTGASAIQIVPSIQPVVEHLDLYQRTPAWVMPHPDRKVTAVEKWLFRVLPITQRLRRAVIYGLLESRILAFAKFPRLMHAAQRIPKRHLAKAIKDSVLRDRLTPRYEMGCKRILISDDYYPALAQPNADVVTDGIAEITPTGIVANDGTERPVDAIVLATGFHVTDSPSFRLVHGIGGRDLLDGFMENGAYLGTTASGFPNLFVLSGPNTGIGHTSLVYMIESQITYVLDALQTMERQGVGAVDLRPDVHAAWMAEMQSASEGTVWSSGCQSWYLDDKGRNATLWPGFTFEFRRRTKHFDIASYETTPVRDTMTHGASRRASYASAG